ncbi:MAG: tripartite tricarboxylate transporter substrate-binding protein [Rhodoferax sp.]|nr:tripartite tricarboxylate transporter substrate-binding protein [Rhodoferax sp.]
MRSGKVRMLAVAGTKRSSFFPEVPTLSELGFKGAELDINARMGREIAKALAQANTKTRYESLGAEPVGMDSVEFRKLLAEEGRALTALIKERKIVLE